MNDARQGYSDLTGSQDPTVKVEPLGPHHDRTVFACGEPALDAYIRHQASQDMRRRISQVFVARVAPAQGDAPALVAGYYSLSAASFSKEELPTDRAKRLPHYPVPAAILGRLGVDRAYQGRGIGGALLFDAFERVLRASAAMAVHALIVEAKNDRARSFYEQYGFETFPNTPHRLFLPLETLAKAAR